MAVYNILLAEDDEVDVMAVERAFEKANIANPLFKAKNGVEALDYLRGTNGKTRITRPFIVLLDLNMPLMSGLEFLHQIRQDPELYTTTVVVFTSSRDEQDIVQSYDKLVAGYMTKPVTVEQFVEKMALLGNYWTLCELPS